MEKSGIKDYVRKLRKAGMAGEAVRFAAVGVFATGLHYAIYYLLLPLLSAGVAYTIGYGLSLVANFFLTARFTFRSRPTGGKAAGFALSHGVNYLLHISLLQLFLHLGVPPRLAPLPVFAIAIPVNFLLVRFVFHHGGKKQ